MGERLRWLGHVLRMKDDRLTKIVHFGQPFRAKRKGGRQRLGWKDVLKKRNENLLGGCKDGGFEFIGMEGEHA